MNRYERPSRDWRSASRFRICAWIDTSSALTGSSSTTSSGSSASARAMPTRWRCPPESSCGYRSMCSAPRPTSSNSSGTRVRDVAPPARDHERLGDRRARGHARIERRVRVLEHHLDPTPGEVRSLSRGRLWSSRRIRRATVDLPLPDSPTSARVSPAPTVKLTPSTACTTPPVPAAEVLDQVVDVEEVGHSSRHRIQAARCPAPSVVEARHGPRSAARVGMRAPGMERAARRECARGSAASPGSA